MPISTFKNEVVAFSCYMEELVMDAMALVNRRLRFASHFLAKYDYSVRYCSFSLYNEVNTI